MVWSHDTLSTYALYGRIVVSYESQGFVYSQVLTLVIGSATPIAERGTQGTALACYLHKQGYSKVALTSTSFQALIMPQTVYNDDEDAKAALLTQAFILQMEAPSKNNA